MILFPEPDIHTDIEQGTSEWFDIRKGCITASEFHTVMSKGRGSAPSKTRRTYMLKLAGEIITGEPQESYSNHHMERGKVMEEEARKMYEIVSGNSVKQVGFIKAADNLGYSPDGLVEVKGSTEIKTKLPHLQIEVLLADRVPPEHIHQCQGGLWVSGREWIDFVSYWPGLPIFIKRIQRDEKFIKEIQDAVFKFSSELGLLVKQIRAI
jgi:putative phage-type endonuclease